MGNRFDILYRFSTDNGATWTDLTPQVNSLQTSITQNLCLNTFQSAKDEATFVMPETPLYNPDGTATPKKQLIDAIFGNDPILVHINETKPGVKVLWDDNDVLWNGNHVMWSSSMRRFTGYVDRSSISLRSYPLPPNLTVRLQDVSVLHLDDKVDRDVCLEDDPDGTRLRISTIVSALLGYAGYTNIGSLALEAGDDQIIEAFVIDKDKAKTYRNYIDTLLFEAGGYVLDFNEYGQANVVHLQWDGSVAANRICDNPMNNDGVTMRTAYLVNDGASVKWSTLAWAENERIWQSNISQKIVDGVMVGDIVHDQGYWPNNSDVSPIYFQYDAKLLDIPYLHKDTRWENEDLSIIMAKNTHFGVDTLKGTTPVPITDWSKHDPNTWPVGDTWHDKYGLDSNPQYWPTKMWIQLQNTSGEDYNVSLAYIYGDVLYRNRINTIKTAYSKNPKEYVSEYIYDKDQAERFLQFYWHFLQTSRYQFTWSEVNAYDAPNSVVSVGIKGNNTMQKSLVVGKTSRWLNAKTEVVTFASVAIDAYVPSQLIPTIIAPSSSNNAVPSTKSAITATFSTAPTFTLAEWEDLETAQQEWTITNPSSFSAGDVAVINGYISDMDNTPIKLYMDVNSITGSVISGVGIRIEYTPIQYQWDFAMSATEAIRQDRDTVNGIYTDIVCESMELGYGLLPYWKILNGDPSLVYFANNHSQLNSGDKVTVRIWAQNTEDKIVIRMASDNTNNPVYKIEKSIAIKNVTEYDHDFGSWEPTGAFLLPDHITVGGEDYDILDGDFFVAKVTFATDGTSVTAVGTEDPSAQGWYDRYGSGTSADPYYYKPTTDTSCSPGDVYYTVLSGDTYIQGVPYGYIQPSWHNAISATTENANRMLKALANVLTIGTDVPSVSALYGWFANLVALNAVIDNLTAINLNVGPGTGLAGSGFRFRALDNSGSPIFDVMYGNVTLFKVDIATGKIYFGEGFWYDPADMAIHSVNDNVVIGAAGDITINKGIYKSDLFCPSFRSMPREVIVNPTVITNPANAETLFNALQNNGFTTEGGIWPCSLSTDSSVKYLTYNVQRDSHQREYIWEYEFVKEDMSSVGSVYRRLIYSSLTYTYLWSSSSYASTTFTIGVASSVSFRLLDNNDALSIPDNVGIANLLKGELYYVADGGGTGTLHIKL